MGGTASGVDDVTATDQAPTKNAGVRPEPEARSFRLLSIGFWSVLATTALLTLADWDSFQLGAYQDDAAYVVLAHSIADGGPFGLIHAPGQPLATRFPCGYPLLLAPLVAWRPDDLELLRLPSLAATWVSLGLIFFGWRAFSTRLSRGWGLAVVALCGLSPQWVEHGRMVMSEAVFTAAALGALVLAERGRDSHRGRSTAVGLGVVSAAVPLFRSIGFTLLPAVFASLWMGRRRLPLITTAASSGIAAILALVALTPLALRDLLPIEYTDQLLDAEAWGHRPSSDRLAPRLLGGAWDYARHHVAGVLLPLGPGGWAARAATASGLPWLDDGLRLAVSLLVGFGLWRWWRLDGLRAVWLWGVVYLVALLAWPWRGERFLYPVQPHLALALLLGVQGTALALPWLRRRATLLVLVVTVTAALFAGVRSLRISDTREHLGDLRLRTQWIATHSAADAVVMSEYPATDYLHGRRHTLPWPNDPDRLVAEGTAGRGDLLLIGPELRWQPRHHPRLSARAQRLLDRLTESGVDPLHHSPEHGVWVFSLAGAAHPGADEREHLPQRSAAAARP